VTFTDPGVALQRAIVAALKTNSEVKALIEDRVYDRVPRNASGEPTVPFPYVTIGEVQTLPELGEATDAAESFVTLHTWSRAAGTVEAKTLSKAVSGALHDKELTLSEGTMQSLLLQDSRMLNDPDGLTSHGILNFQILTDAN
jgi:hypothetical protein